MGHGTVLDLGAPPVRQYPVTEMARTVPVFGIPLVMRSPVKTQRGGAGSRWSPRGGNLCADHHGSCQITTRNRHNRSQTGRLKQRWTLVKPQALSSAPRSTIPISYLSMSRHMWNGMSQISGRYVAMRKCLVRPTVDGRYSAPGRPVSLSCAECVRLHGCSRLRGQ